jgi:hypothetical protein
VCLCARSKGVVLRGIGRSPRLDVSSNGRLSKLRTTSNGDRPGCGSGCGEDGILSGSAGRSLKSNVDLDGGRTDSGSEYREDGLLRESAVMSWRLGAGLDGI